MVSFIFMHKVGSGEGEGVRTPQMLQLLHHAVMCQAIDNAQEEDLIGRSIILMSSPKATIITVERKLPLRHILLHLIWHSPTALAKWDRLFLLDALPQLPSLPRSFNFARRPHEDTSLSFRQACWIVIGVITSWLEHLESFVAEIFF